MISNYASRTILAAFAVVFSGCVADASSVSEQGDLEEDFFVSQGNTQVEAADQSANDADLSLKSDTDLQNTEQAEACDHLDSATEPDMHNSAIVRPGFGCPDDMPCHNHCKSIPGYKGGYCSGFAWLVCKCY